MASPAILLKEQPEKYLGNDYIYETAENGEEGLELIEELLEDEIKILIIVSDCLQ
jgi:isopentenyl diphosphate isomerase/L-lactate dehydrogenase-like FMN-dependent dehydrogenase